MLFELIDPLAMLMLACAALFLVMALAYGRM